MCEESAVQHQNSEADPGGGDVSAEDVLESSSTQHRSLHAQPQEGLEHIMIFCKESEYHQTSKNI